MKLKTQTLMTAAIALVAFNSNAIQVNDDFSGSSIDSSKWVSVTPYSDSSISVGGGLATLSNHGELLSQDSFVAPYEVTGRFQFSGNSFDSFNLAIRTSGNHLDPRFYQNGFMLTVAKQTDDGSRHDLIRITKNNEIVTDSTYAFSVNQFYDFKITDDGTTMNFFFGDLATALVTVTDSDTYGGKVGVYNREGNGGESGISDGSQVQLDYLRINSVPETTTRLDQLLMAAMSAGAFFFVRRSPQRV